MRVKAVVVVLTMALAAFGGTATSLHAAPPPPGIVLTLEFPAGADAAARTFRLAIVDAGGAHAGELRFALSGDVPVATASVALPAGEYSVRPLGADLGTCAAGARWQFTPSFAQVAVADAVVALRATVAPCAPSEDASIAQEPAPAVPSTGAAPAGAPLQAALVAVPAAVALAWVAISRRSNRIRV